MMSLKGILNDELLNQLKKLVAQEQELILKILPHLAEVERRKIYLEKAYSTLTEYCIHELGYGESSAWRRVRAARVIQEIPEVYDLMKRGRLSLSAVLQVLNVLSPAYKDQLLPRVVGKSKSEIDNIKAEFQLPVAIPDRVKPRLVKKAKINKRASGPDLGEIFLHSEGKFDPIAVDSSTPEVEVVLEKMFEIQFAADEELMELIRWMKSLLSHKFPKGASYLEIFKHAITYYKQREDLAERKVLRKSSAKTDTRYISRSVKQQVWKRDGGKCTFVGSNGKRCDSDYLLQFDHHPIPFARGGPSTADNLRLLCAKHNKFTAEKTYGKSHVEKFYLKEAAGRYFVRDSVSSSSSIRLIC